MIDKVFLISEEEALCQLFENGVIPLFKLCPNGHFMELRHTT